MPKHWRPRVTAVNDAGRAIGEGHETAKLSDEDIELIFELAALGLSVRAIAAKFDTGVRVSKSHVHAILRGRKRAQTVMGHRVMRRDTRLVPADPEEFDE